MRLLNDKITYIPRDNKLYLVLGNNVAVIYEDNNSIEAMVKIGNTKTKYYGTDRMELEKRVEAMLLRAEKVKLAG